MRPKHADATRSNFHVDEQAFRTFVESVRDYAIFMLDPTGRVMTWNAGAARLKGWTADEIIGRHFSTFYPPEDQDKPPRELDEALAQGRVEDEGWRLRKDGSRFWASVVITALYDKHGTHIGFGKVTRDLTERKEAEEALRRSEERLRLILDSVQDYAIFMLDVDGRIVSWSAGAERINGYRAEEVLGRHFSIFYPPEEVAGGKCDRELGDTARAGRVRDEGWRVRKDGSRFWAEAVVTAIRDPSGTLVGYVKVTRDLTERRQSEQRLLESEVARARAEARAAESQRALVGRDEFISVASHELRTPLAVARLHGEGLLRTLERKGTVAPERIQGKVGAMLSQLGRLDELVRTLLDASRLTLGKLPLEPEELDLVAVVGEEVARLGDELAAAGCTVSLEGAAQLCGRWDRLRLGQILVNLLTNAMKYGAGKPIEIRVEEADDRARLRVRDHGIGIAPADQRRIFERFERAVSERHFGGLGLGLWITRGVVEAMSGAISVLSVPGQGATFTVELPRR